MKKLGRAAFIVVITVFAGCASDSKSTGDSDIAKISDQRALVDYLDNVLYESEQEHEVGINPDGLAMGKWKISFQDAKFNWTYSDVTEDGEYSFFEENAMTITLPNTSFVSKIDLDNKKLEWMGEIYVRTDQQ